MMPRRQMGCSVAALTLVLLGLLTAMFTGSAAANHAWFCDSRVPTVQCHWYNDGRWGGTSPLVYFNENTTHQWEQSNTPNSRTWQNWLNAEEYDSVNGIYRGVFWEGNDPNYGTQGDVVINEANYGASGWAGLTDMSDFLWPSAPGHPYAVAVYLNDYYMEPANGYMGDIIPYRQHVIMHEMLHASGLLHNRGGTTGPGDSAVNDGCSPTWSQFNTAGCTTSGNPYPGNIPVYCAGQSGPPCNSQVSPWQFAYPDSHDGAQLLLGQHLGAQEYVPAVLNVPHTAKFRLPQNLNCRRWRATPRPGPAAVFRSVRKVALAGLRPGGHLLALTYDAAPVSPCVAIRGRSR